MKYQLKIRDYRGVERADLELGSIALVAGCNEQGKSALAEAARSACTGTPIPIPGIAKKDAHLLVRDGAESGFACLQYQGKTTGEMGMRWPSLTGIAKGEGAMDGSEYAVGLRHILDLNDRDRANALASYVDSTPTEDDLLKAMQDIGYGKEGAARAWQAVARDGWDATWKRTREHAATLKGKWEAASGEKYGSKKAEGWTPTDYPEGADAEQWESRVAIERGALEEVIGQQAVSTDKVEHCKSQAATAKDLEAQLLEAKEARDAKEHERLKLVKAKRPEIPQKPMACPECDTALTLAGGKLLVVTDPPTDEQIEFATAEQKEYDDLLNRTQQEMREANRLVDTLDARLSAANHAADELVRLESAGGTATAEDVQDHRNVLAQLERELQAIHAKAIADKTHREIVKTTALIDVLAPDGLRQRKLAAGLTEFNGRLETLCKAAKWPQVRLDESLKPHYGTRPLWAASKSGQWRARAVIQVAMAMQDGSPIVILDEADMLDARGRNGLIELLKASNRHALVCMTISRKALVPDLAAAGIGTSYWIERGIVSTIGEAS